MIKKFNEYLNESILGNSVSFPASKSWDFTKLKNLVDRAWFKVVNVVDDKAYLENNEESIVIDSDCKIQSHMRNGHKMLQTYNCDDITKRQLKKIFK